MRKQWIAGAGKHPGALHRELHVKPGEKIPAAKLAKAAQAPGKLGARARLAETLSHMNGSKASERKAAHEKTRREHAHTQPPHVMAHGGPMMKPTMKPEQGTFMKRGGMDRDPHPEPASKMEPRGAKERIVRVEHHHFKSEKKA